MSLNPNARISTIRVVFFSNTRLLHDFSFCLIVYNGLIAGFCLYCLTLINFPHKIFLRILNNHSIWRMNKLIKVFCNINTKRHTFVSKSHLIFCVCLCVDVKFCSYMLLRLRDFNWWNRHDLTDKMHDQPIYCYNRVTHNKFLR